jgi:SAM-dependent methyltransferase
MVVATDASRGQLESRRSGWNLRYALARAERAPLADGAADLVTVAQALHWFDLPAFFTEARRVLRPGGLLAAWCFFLPEVNPVVDAAVSRLYHEVFDGYMPPQVGLVIDRYRTVSPPFGEVARTEVDMVERWDLDRFARYLGTWAAVAYCREQTGREPIVEIKPELARGWGSPDALREVRWTISVLEVKN